MKGTETLSIEGEIKAKNIIRKYAHNCFFLEKEKLERYRNRTKEQEIEHRRELEKQEETLKELKLQEEVSRNQVYAEANKASTAQCLMDAGCNRSGSSPCNSCVYRESYSGNCTKWKEELPCVKWTTKCRKYQSVCAEEESVCKKFADVCKEHVRECKKEVPRSCLKYEKTGCANERGWAYDANVWCAKSCGDHSCGPTWSTPCCKAEGNYGWENCRMKCETEVDECTEWQTPYCAEWVRECARTERECVENELRCKSRSNECLEEDEVCAERGDRECLEYEDHPSGMFCSDTGKVGKCCDLCAGSDRIGQILNMILKHSIQLEQKDLSGNQQRTPELLAILKLTVETMSDITGKIRVKQKNPTTSTGPGTTTATTTTTTTTTTTSSNSSVAPTSDEESLAVDKEADFEIDLPEELDLMKKFLPPQKSQISVIAVANKEAAKSQQLMENFIQNVLAWTDGGNFKKLGKADVNLVFKFTDDIRREFDGVKSKSSEEDIQLNLDLDSVSAVNVTKFAEEYITAKGRKVKTAAKVQLASNVIFQALEELANTKIEIDDYKKTIKYLVKCSIHLKKLRVAWGDIRNLSTFFYLNDLKTSEFIF